jgi:hypothetical protein
MSQLSRLLWVWVRKTCEHAQCVFPPLQAINVTLGQYSTRDQSVRFAYVTSLRAEGKQTHILCKPKTLSAKELRQRETKYCRWEVLFTAWTEKASVPAPPPSPLSPLPSHSNGRGTHRLAPTTVLQVPALTENLALTGVLRHDVDHILGLHHLQQSQWTVVGTRDARFGGGGGVDVILRWWKNIFS